MAEGKWGLGAVGRGVAWGAEARGGGGAVRDRVQWGEGWRGAEAPRGGAIKEFI